MPFFWGRDEDAEDDAVAAAMMADISGSSQESVDLRDHNENGPLLTAIDSKHRAELGRLLYTVPAGPVLTTVRNAEIAIVGALSKKQNDVRIREIGNTPASVEKKYSPFLNLAMEHRSGHLRGIGQAIKDKGVNQVVDAWLDVAQQDNTITPSNFAYQAAAFLEATQAEPGTRGYIKNKIKANPAFNQAVVSSGVTGGLEIPGITEDDQDIFPGATKYTLPRTERPSNPLEKQWGDITTVTTYGRFVDLVEARQVAGMADKMIKSIEATA